MTTLGYTRVEKRMPLLDGNFIWNNSDLRRRFPASEKFGGQNGFLIRKEASNQKMFLKGTPSVVSGRIEGSMEGWGTGANVFRFMGGSRKKFATFSVSSFRFLPGLPLLQMLSCGVSQPFASSAICSASTMSCPFLFLLLYYLYYVSSYGLELFPTLTSPLLLCTT